MEEILDLINSKTYFMIDIDGVCIDTEQRIAMIAKENGWKETFKSIDWHEHIYSSQQIHNSIDILRDVQYTLKRIQLLTQNHTTEEEIKKIVNKQGHTAATISSLGQKLLRFSPNGVEFVEKIIGEAGLQLLTSLNKVYEEQKSKVAQLVLSNKKQ